MNNPWRDINLPVNPWENKKRQQQEAAEKKAAREQGAADEQAEADAYNNKFDPELIDPAWAHADEARADESPDEAFIGDTIILSVKTKGIVPGGGIYCMVRDQSVDAPWKTERKLSGRVADDDTVSIEWEIDKNENDGESPDLTFWFEDKDVNKPAKSPEAKISLAAGTTVNFVEFPDTLFHKGCAIPLLDNDGVLVAALTAVFTSAKKESGSTLVACGHAAKDDSGIYPALEVSASRAKAIKALLADDDGAWSDIAQDFSCAKDIQQYFASAATLLGWSCDPGKVDGNIGPKSKTAIRKYKAAFNAKFEGSLADTEAPDGEFFGSMVTVIRAQVLESYKSASGETSLPDPAWVDSCKGTYGCGTPFPPEKGVSEIGRRVEVYFIPPDAKPVFTEHTDDKTPVTTGECSIYGKKFVRTPMNSNAGDGKDNSLTAAETAQAKGSIESASWEKKWVIAWDSSKTADMSAKIKITTKDMPPEADASVAVYQFDNGGSHTLYKKFESLKCKGDKLFNADGTEFESRIEWHDSIYDVGKTQYFFTVTIDGIEKTSNQTTDALLQLKCYDGVIGNPSGDLPGTVTESNWVYSYLTKYGRWKDAVQAKTIADGHKVRSYGAVGKGPMKSLMERNKFIHHQSSHGDAYCTCDGKKNYVEDSGVAGADGNIDYRCPVCNTYNKAVGCIMLCDDSNLFFTSDVAALKRSPKTLVLANCCLTAITGTYPQSWLKKGTRWYFGWGLPVDDGDAVKFAKAFYLRWMKKYEMSPDDVKKAFNDVKGAYLQYRPKIQGK